MRQYDPRTDFPKRQPDHVRVTFTDGRTTDISSPRLLADTSLTGWDYTEQRSVEYPLSTIKSVVGRERSAARSSLLGLGIVGAICIGGWLASLRSSGEEDGSSPF
jgi:hypothetical protein